MFKLDLEKAEEPEIKLPTSVGLSKKQESSIKNICFIDYIKAFYCVDNNRLWKILQEMQCLFESVTLTTHSLVFRESESVSVSVVSDSV